MALSLSITSCCLITLIVPLHTAFFPFASAATEMFVMRAGRFASGIDAVYVFSKVSGSVETSVAAAFPLCDAFPPGASTPSILYETDFTSLFDFTVTTAK